jgi:hypothetical protein
MEKYIISVTINGTPFRQLFHYPKPALAVFDSIAADTSQEMTGSFLEVAAKEGVTVESISIQRVEDSTPIGVP